MRVGDGGCVRVRVSGGGRARVCVCLLVVEQAVVLYFKCDLFVYHLLAHFRVSSFVPQLIPVNF